MSGRETERSGGGSLLGSSAVMAAGTVVSRLSGFVRTTLLAAALGIGLHADVFNIANTIPNMLYILLAGGVFNAVLVPQLVRALRNDPDGGEAYTNRIITLAALFLAAVSVLLVVAAPLVMRLLLDPQYFTADFAAQRESAIDLARYCLPQVFFYGMFVLVGQILNARGSFGPMMWAPIANNVISVAVLVAYLITVGAARGSELCGGYSTGAEALLGLGSTLGIAVQFLILIPYLRRAGFTFRPRFDFRNSGLGHTLRLGTWTVLFVVVNQIAYTVVVKLSSAGTLPSASACSADGTGYTVYSNAFLLVMVPHSVITVSVATAMLPRLSGHAAENDLRAVGAVVVRLLRATYALVLPLLAILPVVAADVATVLWDWGAAEGRSANLVPTLSLFVIGIFFFTSHYLVLRGFYALEQTRRVFFIQVVVASVNIAAALLLTRDVPVSETAPRLVIAYTLAYAAGSALSYRQLSRQVGGLGGAELVRFGVRLALAVAVSAGVGLLVRLGLHQLLALDGRSGALVSLTLSGTVAVLTYLVAARTFRLAEVTDVVRTAARRLPGRR